MQVWSSPFWGSARPSATSTTRSKRGPVTRADVYAELGEIIA